MILNAKVLAFLALASSSVRLHASAFEYGDGDMAGHYFTYPHPTGNRIIDSSIKGTFPDNVQQIDVEMPADVTWAVGTHHPVFGFKFVVTTADKKAYCVHPPTDTGKPATMEEIKGAQLAADQPPLVRHIDGKVPSIVTIPSLSPLSHPVPAGDGAYAFIDTAGDLVLWNVDDQQEIGRLPGINALPDGRIVRSTNGHMRPWLALYAGAVEYDDGCRLGDCTEASRLLVLRIHPQLGVIDTLADVQLEGDDVFEGISPMFLPDDSVVATVSNPTDGVSVRVYSPNDGSEISKSDNDFGWRHQLFYNDFGTSAKPLPYLVDLHGPHSDQRKEMEFMSPNSAVLPIATTIGQYNTQPSGTRYLDTNVSGDLNGDGIAEAVVPSRYRARIVSVQIDPNSGEAEELWSLNLPNEKKMSSNLAAVGSDTGVALGAASGNVLRMWMPALADQTTDATASTDTTDATTPTDATDATTPEDSTTNMETIEGEMEKDYEDVLQKVRTEEQDKAKQQAALLGALLGVLVVVTGLFAFVFGKRRGSRKQMDTGTSANGIRSALTSPANSARSALNTSGRRDLALDACTPDNSMDIGNGEDSDDEEMGDIAIRLDRDVLIPEVI